MDNVCLFLKAVILIAVIAALGLWGTNYMQHDNNDGHHDEDGMTEHHDDDAE